MSYFTAGLKKLIDINFKSRTEEHKLEYTFKHYKNEVATIKFYVGKATDYYSEINELYTEGDSIIIVKNFAEKSLFVDKIVFTEEDIKYYRHKTLKYKYIYILNPSNLDKLEDILTLVFSDFEQIIMQLGK